MLFLECFFALKKQQDEQIAPNIATINRANVMLSPVSASLADRFIPRKLTVLSGVGGALVPADKRERLSFILNRLPTIPVNLSHIRFSGLKFY